MALLKHNLLPLEEVVPPLFRTFFLPLTSATATFCHWLSATDFWFSKEGEIHICYLTTECSGQQVLSEDAHAEAHALKSPHSENGSQCWKLWLLSQAGVVPGNQNGKQFKNIRNVKISLTISVTKRSWWLSDIFLIISLMSSDSKHMWIPNWLALHIIFKFQGCCC